MDVLAELVRHSDLRFLGLVTGPYDILAELNLRREESLHARIVERILAIDGVQRCDTDLTLHVYKVVARLEPATAQRRTRRSRSRRRTSATRATSTPSTVRSSS